MKILVLGLGNELCGDDGVGIHVVRSLKRNIRTKGKNWEWLGKIDFKESSLSGLALLDDIIGYDRLVVIDTIKKENPIPGQIHLLEEKKLRSIPGPSPHYVSFPQTLEIGRKLGLKVPREIQVIAVEAKNIYHLGEGLSEKMKEALPAILQKAREVLKNKGRKWQKKKYSS